MDDIVIRLARRLFDRPLIQNSFRGAFVEELIAPLLAHDGWRHCGDDWSSWDFEHATGLRLELKQSAKFQSWQGNGADNPSFSIQEKTGYWSGSTFTQQAGRPAHIYLFAWHGVPDRAVADHRAADQWEFFVLDARVLPPNQKTIRLSVLKSLGAKPIRAGDLAKSVAALGASLAHQPVK